MGEISVIELFFQATLVVKLVILILIIASVLTWLIIFERNLYFKNFKKNSDLFEENFIATNDFEITFSQLKDQFALHFQKMQMNIISIFFFSQMLVP